MEHTIPLPSLILKNKKQEIEELAEFLGLLDVKIFGSVARHEDTIHSDIDFLVTPNPKDNFSLYRFAHSAKKILGLPINVVDNRPYASHINSPIYREAVREAVCL